MRVTMNLCMQWLTNSLGVGRSNSSDSVFVITLIYPLIKITQLQYITAIKYSFFYFLSESLYIYLSAD